MIRKLSALALTVIAIVGFGTASASAAPASGTQTIISANTHPQDDGLWWP